MQNRRALIFFAFAILFGVAAAFTAHRALESRVAVAPEATPIRTVEVVIARAGIATGAALTTAELTTVDWPADFAPQGSFSEPALLHGRVLKHALSAGEPVLEAALQPEGTAGGLIGVISEDNRAVSVKVDQIIGVAGFVTPGARVDVLATMKALAERNKLPYTKTVLQDVRVLAIDQKMEEADSGQPELVSVVTLEVKPQDAEKLIYSAHEGRLQLALRPPSDREIVETRAQNASTVLARRRVGGRIAPSVQIVSGAQVSKKSY